MDFTFLSASVPIIKQYFYLKKNGELTTKPYPFVYEFTSHTESVSSLSALEPVIRTHANRGNCLLKSNPHRPLVKESRKGSTDKDAKTAWVCLDLDGVTGFSSVDSFLDAIGCGQTEYILQWSSSMGLSKDSGLHCHVFMLLPTEVHPQLLKNWLISLNLTTPTLHAQLTLTKTGNSLLWPLDVTTCQNDKLLYIAPPKLTGGIKNPFPGDKRITFVKKPNKHLQLPYPLPSRDALRHLIDQRVNDLRVKQGLPKRRASKYKFAGEVEFMVNPDSAQVTDIKAERGFIYLNLNGGDSWGYYHPEDDAQFIYNFKGEPTYQTATLLPEYWATLQATRNSQQTGITYLAFRDFRTSNYYNGTYDQQTNQLNIAMAKNESQLRQFLTQNNRALGEFVPDWSMVWDPHSSDTLDPINRTLNTFQASPYINPRSKGTQQPTPTIDKVISHVLGGDSETIDHFLNWFACVFQHRTRTGTAWVWQGCQGTGKGVLFHHILTPLLGEWNVSSKRMEELESEFTGFMENKFLVFIDEIEAGRSLYHSKITAKLKNLIVEPTISIRKMYHPAYMAPNHSNMIFASNKSAAVELAPDDRRFNVGPYQTDPIKLTAKEVDTQIPKELEAFAHFLLNFNTDPNRARTPLQSSARDTMIEISRTAIDTVSDALLRGDLEFLWDHLPANLSSQNTIQMMKLMDFKHLLFSLVDAPDPVLTRDELFTIFEWCVGQMPQSPNKFTSLLKHHKILLTQVWKHNRNVRGIRIDWKIDRAWLDTTRKEMKKMT